MPHVECFLGIDLGSTTTKAVVLDTQGVVLGRGMTGSRGSYELAVRAALREAMTQVRFTSLHLFAARAGGSEESRAEFLHEFRTRFRQRQLRTQCAQLDDHLNRLAQPGQASGRLMRAVEQIVSELPRALGDAVRPHSDEDVGLRLLAARHFACTALPVVADGSVSFEAVTELLDRAFLRMEQQSGGNEEFSTVARAAWEAMEDRPPEWDSLLRQVCELELRPIAWVGTGYGRQALPFPRDHIRSEILCHALGAHTFFPGTRTVLDIGGQDTKAIQVDAQGNVISFQMNDRCAAGCGRYLGYLASALGIELEELGPLAVRSRRPLPVNSTCTVFAGAELAERLVQGQNREDVLAGAHRAIAERAMSLVIRTGGARNEFTPTGGVVRNIAAVAAICKLLAEHGNSAHTNISPESVYFGALGAAMFAMRKGNRAGAAQRAKGSPTEDFSGECPLPLSPEPARTVPSFVWGEGQGEGSFSEKSESPHPDPLPAQQKNRSPECGERGHAWESRGETSSMPMSQDLDPGAVLTAGIDVGSSAVKVAIVRAGASGDAHVLARQCERIRFRPTVHVVDSAFTRALVETGLQREQLAYVATTGQGELVTFRTGHFFDMTALARGGLFLEPAARAVLDIGAIHTRVLVMDQRGRVQRHRISSQCASGAGQFLENVGRSLGVSLADTDTMARQSTDPKSCSPVCAVLAETDVINQFSHGASVPDLLQGVHRFIASLCTRLLNSTGASGVALVTGGTARSHSMLGAIREAAADLEAGLDIRVHADSLFAGAIGAALWGAYRARRYAHQPAALARMSAVPQPPPLPATPATLPTELARWKP